MFTEKSFAKSRLNRIMLESIVNIRIFKIILIVICYTIFSIADDLYQIELHTQEENKLFDIFHLIYYQIHLTTYPVIQFKNNTHTKFTPIFLLFFKKRQS